MNARGQYLYENYCLVFGTIFAPKWEGLSEESRSNWAKIEAAVYTMPVAVREPITFHSSGPIISTEEVHWHPKGCDCGNCAGGTMPVQVVTVTLPSANAPTPQPSSTPEKSVNEERKDRGSD